MTLIFSDVSTDGAAAGAVDPPSAFSCSFYLPRTSNMTSWLLAGLSLSDGSPAIQSLLVGFLLLASGTAFDCLKALLPVRAVLTRPASRVEDWASTDCGRQVIARAS